MGVKGFLKEATLTAGDEGTHGDMTQVEFERQKVKLSSLPRLKAMIAVIWILLARKE